MFFRKNILLSTILILSFSLTSCNDNLLETEPPGTLSNATFWETEQDARIAVNDLYNYLYDVEVFDWDSMSDIGSGAVQSRGLTIVAIARGELQSDNTYIEEQWDRNYRGIRAVNDLLVNIDQIENIDQDLKDRYIAEARFIRAYLYAYLVMFYGDVPLIKDQISIEEGSQIARTNKEEIWDFIDSELQNISSDLPVSYSSNDKGRITKGAALAMKARAMLWAGRYQEAADAAQNVINLGVYQLYPTYENLFSYQAENNSEVILDKQFIKNDYSNSVFQLLGPNSQNNAVNVHDPTKNLIDAYEMQNGMAIDESGSGFDPRNPYDDRDPRLGYSNFVLGDTLPNGQIYDPRPDFGGPDDIEKGFNTTSTGFNLQKYVNPEDLDQPSNSGINIILIRYAEVLLTYAEAKTEMNDIDQSVYEAINEVRERPDVDMPAITSPKSQEELRQIVQHERLVELAYEGQRYFDIRRWEIAPEVMNGQILGMRYVDENGDLKTFVMTDYPRGFEAPKHYVWPIPQKERELNSNLEQNPGY